MSDHRLRVVSRIVRISLRVVLAPFRFRPPQGGTVPYGLTAFGQIRTHKIDGLHELKALNARMSAQAA